MSCYWERLLSLMWHKYLTKKLTMLSALKSFKSKFLLSAIFHWFNLQPLMINKYFKNKQKPPIRQINREIGNLAMFLRSCGRADIRLCLFTLPCAIGASCLVIKLVIQCSMCFRHCVHSYFRLSVSSVLSHGFCLLRQFYWWHGSGLLKILSWAHT